jgi:CheY-like chemotaxis protein
MVINENLALMPISVGDGNNAGMKKSILVIEDDESIREFVSAFLKEEGYDVFLAENGAAGLRILQACEPGLILLDIWMPIMGGQAFMDAYRRMPEPHAPIIGMSANRQDAALLSTVSGFIAKPFNLDELLGCVKQYIS